LCGLEKRKYIYIYEHNYPCFSLEDKGNVSEKE